MLKLPSLKKRKNPSRQEVQESGSKKTRGSAPKMSVKTYDVEVTSEAGKNVVEETIEIVDDHVSAEKVQEKMVGNPSKRSSRAFGPAAATPEVSKKKVTKTKRRKLKLTAEEEDEYEKEEAIRIIEELKEKEAAEEALLVDSWESSEKAVPNQFLDGPFSKEDLVVKLTNRGIYEKVNFDNIPDYVINGPKHAKNIPYTVPVKNPFSKILFGLSPKTNCIVEGAASASDRILDETPIVIFVPSPESMGKFSEHVMTLIAVTDKNIGVSFGPTHLLTHRLGRALGEMEPRK
jgi:hypothetical protein